MKVTFKEHDGVLSQTELEPPILAKLIEKLEKTGVIDRITIDLEIDANKELRKAVNEITGLALFQAQH